MMLINVLLVSYEVSLSFVLFTVSKRLTEIVQKDL